MITPYGLIETLKMSRDLLNTSIKEFEDVMAATKKVAPVKNGKPPVKKPKTVKALTYTLKHSQRGRVPEWVLKQAKCKNKPALTKKFKDGHRFVLGA